MRVVSLRRSSAYMSIMRHMSRFHTMTTSSLTSLEQACPLHVHRRTFSAQFHEFLNKAWRARRVKKLKTRNRIYISYMSKKSQSISAVHCHVLNDQDKAEEWGINTSPRVALIRGWRINVDLHSSGFFNRGFMVVECCPKTKWLH